MQQGTLVKIKLIRSLASVVVVDVSVALRRALALPTLREHQRPELQRPLCVLSFRVEMGLIAFSGHFLSTID